MNINWQSCSQQQFLKDYWQQRPILLKNAIPNFIDPISPDELAGLAMEDFIDSRVVQSNNSQWQVEHGPFEQFEHFGDSHWTLLVQGVDCWSAPVSELKSLVSFLPAWQIDDIMISSIKKKKICAEFCN